MTLGRAVLGLGALFCGVAPVGLAWAQDQAAPLDLGPTRYAVVIGNSDYEAIPDLQNTIADATAVADLFRDEGYFVSLLEDVSKREFEQVFQQLLFDVDPQDEVVVYYAGHGFQVGTENYLLPVDADLESSVDLPFEAVSLGSLVDIVGSRAKLQIFILDSCRDNPFAGRSTLYQVGNDLREVRTGFSTQAAPINSLLIFSTAPGSVAYDGAGPNSPFTSAFVEVVRQQPEAAVERVVQGVRQRVYESTEGRQIPWDSSTLTEPATFGRTSQGASAPEALGVVERLGADRGFVLAQISVGPSGEADAPLPEITIASDFARVVAIGGALREGVGAAADQGMTLRDLPAFSELATETEGGLRRLVAGEEVAAEELETLVLLTGSAQIPATSLPDGIVRDRLAVEVDGRAVEVGIEMQPDPCDFEAGDRLDPDGSGLTRFPNEIRPEIALVACEASVRREPDNGRFHYQLGRALVALRRYSEAQEAFTRGRDLGHARAWNALGGMLLNEERRQTGLGEAIGSAEVLALYEEGVELGDPYAYYSLGLQLLKYGRGQDDQIRGYDLMMRALEVGHTFPMNALGEFYLTEGSDYYNPERGLRYFKESAARGDIYGYNNLGLAYLRGRGGLEIDNGVAFDLFLRAAEGGHPSAPYNVARMHRDGTAPSGRDLREAVVWFASGLERGDALAGAQAAYLLRTEEIPGFDRFDAAVMAAKGAALGETDRAADAREQLESMPDDVIDGGAQRLILALGGQVEVDGAFGPGSQQEMSAILERFGAGPAATDPADRAVQLARLYWQTSPFRVDLY